MNWSITEYKLKALVEYTLINRKFLSVYANGGFIPFTSPGHLSRFSVALRPCWKKNNSDSCQMPISIIGYFSDMRHLTTTSFIEKSTAKVRSRSQYRKTCLLLTRKIRRGPSGLAKDAKIESFIKNSFHKYRLNSTIAFFRWTSSAVWLIRPRIFKTVFPPF